MNNLNNLDNLDNLDNQDKTNLSTSSLSWPLPFSFFLVGSLLYSFYNLVLFLLGVSIKDIWFVPGPLARILQGIILFLLFSYLYFIHSTRLKTSPSFSYPSNFVLFGFLISLTVHYIGMLPPLKIYDTFHSLDKLIHFLNCFWLAWLFVWFFSLHGYSSPLRSLLLKAFSLSFLLGFLWEVLEFVSLPSGIDWWNAESMSYGFKDTIFDLIFDFLGSLFGAIYAVKKTS